MKVLVITNKVKTYNIGFKNVIQNLIDKKFKVYWAADFSTFVEDKATIPCEIVNIPINSNPLKVQNIKAYKLLLKFCKDTNIDVIYCSTPIGGTVGRLLGKKLKVKKVIYAAHGFLFHSKVPFFKRIIFMSHEKILAKYTDVLITITKEDYNAALKFKLKKNGTLYYVHGAGVDFENIKFVDKKLKRQMLSIPDKAFVIISAGFLNRNKNNEVIIKALKILNNKNIYYLVCGEGKLDKKLKHLCSKYKLENVKFLGFRTDIYELMQSSNLFVMPSFREGVPRSLLEAMYLGLPCIGSDTRGISELINHGVGGYVCNPKNPKEFAKYISMCYDSYLDCEVRNKNFAQQYSEKIVFEELKVIFEKELDWS